MSCVTAMREDLLGEMYLPIYPSYTRSRISPEGLHCTGICMSKIHSLPFRCLQLRRKINDQCKANVQVIRRNEQSCRENQVCFNNLKQARLVSQEGLFNQGGLSESFKGLSSMTPLVNSSTPQDWPPPTLSFFVPWTTFSANTVNFVALFSFFPLKTLSYSSLHLYHLVYCLFLVGI